MFLALKHLLYGTLVTACLTAQAQPIEALATGADHRIYTDIGTQGVGIGYAQRLTDSVDARVGMTSLKLKRTAKGGANNNGATFDAEATLNFTNLGLYADWYVFDGGFRLTSGVQLGANKLDINGNVSANQITLNGKTYVGTANARVLGGVDLGSTAPYVGMGYASRGSANSAGLSLIFDLGVRLGKAETSLNASGFDNLSAADKAQFESDLAKERAKLQDKLGVLKTYPVLSLGLSYRW
ncbi:hypothetical protein [Limnohabitans sp.]|uniref:hypothetical protein n=1 Tax=Limnohabitans sp. TaxID=1907725 RepID=UPI00286F4711|nr:hypothetical protein [Limnohabitans sp.]